MEHSQASLLPAASPGLLVGPWWPLAPGRSWTMGRPVWSMALVWEQAQGAFSKSGPGLPGEAGREMWRGCSVWLCAGRMMVKGHVRFSKGLALLQPFGGCSDAYSNPSGPGSAEGIPPSGSVCAVAPYFYSSFSCFARTISWLRISCGGSFWLHQMLSCLMQLLRDSPMQPTKTV